MEAISVVDVGEAGREVSVLWMAGREGVRLGCCRCRGGLRPGQG